jgi:hypothetical protein
MSQEEKEYQNSEYNRRVVKVTEQYLALVKIQLQNKLKEMKDGARLIANRSKNPELQKIVDKLDRYEIK